MATMVEQSSPRGPPERNGKWIETPAPSDSHGQILHARPRLARGSERRGPRLSKKNGAEIDKSKQRHAEGQWAGVGIVALV